MIQLRDVVAVWPSSWWLPIKRFLLLRMQVLIAIIGKHAIKKKNDGRGNEGDTGATAWSRGRRSLSTEVCCATITGTSSGWTLSTTPTVGFVKRMPRNCLPRTTHNQVGLATCSKVPPIDAYWLLQSDVWKRACSGTCRELLLESKYASGGEDTTIVEQNLRVQILSSVDLLFVRKFYQQILVVCRCVFFDSKCLCTRQTVSCRKCFCLWLAHIFASITIPFVLPDLPGTCTCHWLVIVSLLPYFSVLCLPRCPVYTRQYMCTLEHLLWRG